MTHVYQLTLTSNEVATLSLMLAFGRFVHMGHLGMAQVAEDVLNRRDRSSELDSISVKLEALCSAAGRDREKANT